MASKIEQPHWTEPVIVPCHLVEGLAIEVRDDLIRLCGFVDLETVEDRQPERRIVVRAAMTKTVARALVADLRKVLWRPGH